MPALFITQYTVLRGAAICIILVSKKHHEHF